MAVMMTMTMNWETIISQNLGNIYWRYMTKRLNIFFGLGHFYSEPVWFSDMTRPLLGMVLFEEQLSLPFKLLCLTEHTLRQTGFGFEYLLALFQMSISTIQGFLSFIKNCDVS